MAGFSPAQFQFWFEGQPASGGSVNVYQTGTTTPVLLYSDAALTQPVNNPFTLDENGECSFYVGSTVNLRFDAYTSNNTFIETLDPVYIIPDLTALNSAINLSFGGYVNKFRNGTFDVAQRGTSGSTSSSSGVYTLDGWILGSDGTRTIPWTQTYEDLGSFYSNNLVLQGASSTTATFIKQRIESTIAAPLANNTVTVQWLIYNATAAILTPTLTISHATLKDNWGATVVDIPAVSLQSIAVGVSGIVSYTYSAPQNSALGIEARLDFGAALNSATNFIHISNADIRVIPSVTIIGLNNNPPSPELRPISVSTEECARYYNNSFPTGTAPAAAAGVTGSFEFSQTLAASTALNLAPKILFPTRMRIAPAVTLYNPITAANSNIRNSTVGADFTASTADHIDEQGFNPIGTTPGGTAVGQICNVHYQATAEL